MKRLNFVLLFLALALCVAGPALRASAQGKGGGFDSRMTLNETVAWLGQQPTHVAASPTSSVSGGYVRRHETRLVKAKGCTLSYQVSSTTDSHFSSYNSAAAATETR